MPESGFPMVDGVSNPSGKHMFTVTWSNDSVSSKNMTRHTSLIRAWDWPLGLFCKALYLDQVFIIFRPSADIPPSLFVNGDAADKTWRAETLQLYVRSSPGHEHPVFAEGMGYRPLTYSQSLSVTPDVEGTEDYWCRTYRPLRDIPIAEQVAGCTELSLELLFPTLFFDPRSVLEQIPSYRILKVICHFSADV